MAGHGRQRRRPGGRVLTKYEYEARKRGINWALSPEDFVTLISLSCHYCGRPPSNRDRKRVYTGIDRVDNTKGYEAGNVVPCCRECNMIKGDRLTESEMLAVARALKRERRKKAR